MVSRSGGNGRAVPQAIATNVNYASGTTVGNGSGQFTQNIWYPARTQDRTTLRPCAVVIPGGGYTTIDTTDQPICPILWKAGFVVFEISYRTNGGNATKYCKMSDSISDVFNFMEWLYANASAYGGDASRVLMVGGSSGAGLVLRCALTNGYGHARPKMAWCMSPDSHMDLVDISVGTDAIGPPWQAQFIYGTGGNSSTQASQADYWTNVSNGPVGTADDLNGIDSPYYWIANHPEVYHDIIENTWIRISTTSQDTTLNYYHGVDMDAKLTALGIPHDYKLWNTPAALHGYGQIFVELTQVWPTIWNRIGPIRG